MHGSEEPHSETSDRILAAFDEKLQDYAKERFAREGMCVAMVGIAGPPSSHLQHHQVAASRPPSVAGALSADQERASPLTSCSQPSK
jgi:hypothetical protein